MSLNCTVVYPTSSQIRLALNLPEAQPRLPEKKAIELASKIYGAKVYLAGQLIFVCTVEALKRQIVGAKASNIPKPIQKGM